MALPAAGNSISLQQVNVELGETGTDAINMGGSAVRGLFGVAEGAIDMSDGFGKSSEIGITASAASSANLKTLFDNNTAGSWAADEAKRYTVGASTVMGILTAPASMGGTLIIDLAGEVQGTSGAAGDAGGDGGAGGTAMTIQSTGITVNVTGYLRGGGGGGSGGGAGGAGGRGSVTTRPCANIGACCYCNVPRCSGVGNLSVSCSNGPPTCYSNNEDPVGHNPTCTGINAGGAAGAGGAGGRGIGYGVALASGSSGSSGASGATNAGTGGTGGAGGDGKTWGTAGGTGATGATGANGNNTNGSSGSSGGTAGAAGRAITFSGVSAYTIIGTSSGTIAGAYT